MFSLIWKKCNEIQLTKNKIGLNIPKMTNHPPSPERININFINIKFHTIAKLCSLYKTNYSLHKKYYTSSHFTTKYEPQFGTKRNTDPRERRGDTGHHF